MEKATGGRVDVVTYVLSEDDHECHLNIALTNEGIIADLIDGDEVIKTWGATFQEIADDYCH